MLMRINSVPEALRAGPDRTIRLHRSRGGTPAAWGQVPGRLARLKGLEQNSETSLGLRQVRGLDHER